MNAIISFMAEMGLNKVYVTAFEQWSEEVRNRNSYHV